MATRIFTSVIGLPITVLIVGYGGIYLQIAIFILALIGMFEFYLALSKGRKAIHNISYLFSAIYFGLLHTLNSNLLMMLTASFMLCVLFFLIFTHEKNNIIDGAITLIGFYYIAFLFSFVYITRSLEYGEFFVWLIFISAWGSDTGAYFTGITIGKHKLCPKLSPKKTVEGSIGGVIFAVIISFGFGLVINNLYGFDRTLIFVITTFFASICSQFGDLSASAIKRFTNIKDFGRIIIGHGGVLDRFDSIIFTAPIVYLVVIIGEMLL